MVELMVTSVCRTGSLRAGNHFFVVNRFFIFFMKFVNVIVHTPANHNPGLGSIIPHGINVDVNSILILVPRNLDFEY